MRKFCIETLMVCKYHQLIEIYLTMRLTKFDRYIIIIFYTILHWQVSQNITLSIFDFFYLRILQELRMWLSITYILPIWSLEVPMKCVKNLKCIKFLLCILEKKYSPPTCKNWNLISRYEESCVWLFYSVMVI
jgi:hypothetical protein